MKKYQRDHRKKAQIPFTQSSKPMIRFGGEKERPIMHLNRAAIEALDAPARVALSWDEKTGVIAIAAATTDEGLLLWDVTPFFRGLSAVGFVAWSRIDWPVGQTVEAEVLGSGLWIELPRSVPGNERNAEIG